MNCEQVRELLSAYHDGELDSLSGKARAAGMTIGRSEVPAASAVPLTRRIRDHLADCESCSCDLRSYERLRDLVSSQPTHQYSPPAWESIEVAISSGTTLATGSAKDSSTPATVTIPDGLERPVVSASPLKKARRWAISGLLSLAASALLLFSLRTLPHGNDTVANQPMIAMINLQPVMELFKTDPAQALETLANQHPTEDSSPTIAASEMTNPMVVQASMNGGRLPGNAQLVSTKLIKFPYCKCPEGACTCGPGGCQCVACVCQRPDGSTYLVLEHCKSQSITFGDLPVRLVKRGDRHLQQVEIDGTMAISWEQMGDRMTAIGLRSDDEIDMLLALN